MNIQLISLFEPKTESDWLIPDYKTDGAAAIDLRANIDEPVVIPEGVITPIPLGIKLNMSENPDMAALLLPRSGLGGRGFTLMNSPGLVDSDYQGEITAMMVNLTNSPIRVNRGDRICQLLFTPILQPRLELTNAFSETTERGEQGYGHTGNT